MKKILFLLTLTSTLLFSSFIQKEDLCSSNLLNFISDKNDYAIYNKFPRKNSIKIKNFNELNYRNILKIAEQIEYEKPYNEYLANEFFKELKINRALSEENIKGFNNENFMLGENSFKKVFGTLAIFTISPNVKDKLRKIYLDALKNHGLKRYFLIEKSYKKLAILKSLKLLPEKEIIKYEKYIDLKKKENISYKIYLDLEEGVFTPYKYFGDDTDMLKYKNKLINKMNRVCHSKFEIAVDRQKMGISSFILLFAYSKIYPDIAENIKKYYYAVSTNSNIWDLLEYLYSKNNKDYEKASFALKNFYLSEGKPDYMIPIISDLEILRAKEAFSTGYIFESWVKAHDSLKKLLKESNLNNGLNSKNFKNSKIAKEILKDTAKDLIVEFSKKKDIKTAKYIQYETNKFLNILFKRKLY